MVDCEQTVKRKELPFKVDCLNSGFPPAVWVAAFNEDLYKVRLKEGLEGMMATEEVANNIEELAPYTASYIRAGALYVNETLLLEKSNENTKKQIGALYCFGVYLCETLREFDSSSEIIVSAKKSAKRINELFNQKLDQVLNNDE